MGKFIVVIYPISGKGKECIRSFNSRQLRRYNNLQELVQHVIEMDFGRYAWFVPAHYPNDPEQDLPWFGYIVRNGRDSLEDLNGLVRIDFYRDIYCNMNGIAHEDEERVFNEMRLE